MVHLYTHDLLSTCTGLVKEPKDFRKIILEFGGSKELILTIRENT
ncbi:hypothetical protein [Mucilaginibacter sp. CSA2-8R]